MYKVFFQFFFSIGDYNILRSNSFKVFGCSDSLGHGLDMVLLTYWLESLPER